MSVISLAKTGAEVVEALRISHDSLLAQPSVSERIKTRLAQWTATAASELKKSFPFHCHDTQFKKWQTLLKNGEIESDALQSIIGDYVSFCKAVGTPSNEKFWRGQFALRAQGRASRKSAKSAPLLATQSLLDEWQKGIDQARNSWELNQINQRRAELLKELGEILELLQQLTMHLETLGLETGILFDLSIGALSAQEVERFRRWASYLSNDPGVRALLQTLGKLRQIELSERLERVRVSRTDTITLPDLDSREEIMGVRLGRDLEHMLPSELALLSDPDTALLFDLKYAEGRLMCFDMQGLQTSAIQIEIEEDRTTQDDEKQGPMIICVDTSGSMQGAPETIAKAVALFMASKAKEQNRPCYLINFSTRLEKLNLSATRGMDDLMSFLSKSFHGGTDLAPALDESLKLMQGKTYRNADVLVVSDFIMASLPERLLNSIAVQRDTGSRFHSLVVGDCYMTNRLTSLFDQEWVYDPVFGKVHELLSFQQVISATSSN